MGDAVRTLFDLVVFPVVGGVAGVALGTLVLGGLGGFLGFGIGGMAVLLVTTRDRSTDDDVAQRVTELEREVEELRRKVNDANE